MNTKFSNVVLVTSSGCYSMSAAAAAKTSLAAVATKWIAQRRRPAEVTFLEKERSPLHVFTYSRGRFPKMAETYPQLPLLPPATSLLFKKAFLLKLTAF